MLVISVLCAVALPVLAVKGLASRGVYAAVAGLAAVAGAFGVFVTTGSAAGLTEAQARVYERGADVIVAASVLAFGIAIGAILAVLLWKPAAKAAS